MTYALPNRPMHLLSGRTVNFPATEGPRPGDCLPYMCGADPANESAKYWCSFHGHSGALDPCGPACAPFRSRIPQVILCDRPRPPQAVGMGELPEIPVLTPQNITQPLPDITRTLAPELVPTEECSLWCNLNAAIGDNPVIAVAVLAVVAIAFWPKGARRGR